MEPFVGRADELNRLNAHLERALAGEGQVCFVVGEAGSGKTALATEFARRALEGHTDLVAAVGQCDAQTGVGDSYLPFREVLAHLTGDVDPQQAQDAITRENAGRLRRLLQLSGQALVEVGPDLIGAFIPFAGLATRVASFVAEKAGWLDKLETLSRRQETSAAVSAGIDQDHIFEQYTNVLQVLAEQNPLLLLLDDLQWADAASLELLFRLGRRIGSSRILILGTYRPAEVALGRAGERHPLEKVLNELRRSFGEIVVNLDQDRESTCRPFVDALLDSEPNRLGETFRGQLFHRTGGHPLFTVELLRSLQERGDLVRNAHGEWVEGPRLEWDLLPTRVDGVVEERLGRLAPDLRQTVDMASVEGEEFTAEVVARVQHTAERDLVHQLSADLAQQHRLVVPQGTMRVGRQRLSRYRFQHNLFQRYLYGRLDEVERSYLHEDVGMALEGLYGEHAGEIPVELAYHFAQAGLAERAVPYMRRAGEQAAARYANTEAIAHFSQALELLAASEIEVRYDLLLARERLYDRTGQRQKQEADLATLEALLPQVEARRPTEAAPARSRRAQVLLRQAHYADATSNYPQAIALAEAAVSAAQETHDAYSESLGRLQWGETLCQQGEYSQALAQLEQALALTQQEGFRHEEAQALRLLGVVAERKGDLAQAGNTLERARELFLALGNRSGEANALNSLGIIALNQRRLDSSASYFEETLGIRREIGDLRGQGAALSNLSIVRAYQDNLLQAQIQAEEALSVFRQLGDRRAESYILNNLGRFLEARVDYTAAAEHYGQFLGISRQIGDRDGESAALSNLGIVSTWMGDHHRAQSSLDLALQVSGQTGNRWRESRVLSNKSVLSYDQGNYAAARDHGQQALQIAEELDDLDQQAHAQTVLGHALVELALLPEATAAYEHALRLRQQLEQPFLALEPEVGLAQVALLQEDGDQAQTRVQAVLHALRGQGKTFAGLIQPIRTGLSCYRVLTANRDARAAEVLHSTLRTLQQRAAHAAEEEHRHTLEGVAANREVLQAAEKNL